MINRKISESKLLRKVRETTTQEQFYEAILYETVMSLSHENVEESIKIINEVILEYPYMRNTLRTSLMSAVMSFTKAFKTLRFGSIRHCFDKTNLKEICCPRFIEDVAKYYSLNTEIMNTFKFEQPFLNTNLAIDSPNSFTEYHKGYLLEAIIFKSSKVIEKLYQINERAFLEELNIIIEYDRYKTLLLRFLTPKMHKFLFEVCPMPFERFSHLDILNECHVTTLIESSYKNYDTKHNGLLSTNNLYASYLTYSHNGNFFGIDLINEFKLRPNKCFGNFAKHSLIESWCENIINYLKIDFNEYLREYHVYVFRHNHIETSIENILERVDMMKPIEDSTTILQAAVNGNNEIFVKKILEKHPELVIVNDNLGNNVFNYFKKFNDKIFTMLSKEIIKRFSKDVLISMLLKETHRRKSFCSKLYKNDIEGFLGMIERLH